MISYKLRWILASLSETRQHGRDPFNQNSNRSDREKRTTSKGGPVFSKLFRLDRTDPLSFGPKFPESLVEWIALHTTLNLAGNPFFWGCNTAGSCAREHDLREVLHDVVYVSRQDKTNKASRKGNRPIRLTQCCTQFKSPGDKILCVLHLHYNVAFTFKWYGNSWNKTFYSQRVWIGYNIELAE